MRRAAEKAGLVKEDGSDAERLTLVLEPEAAAIAALATMAPSEAARVVPGTKILIADCGGGTIDMTSSVVRRFEGTDLQLDELQLPGGGPWGGTAVDREFLQFLGAYVCYDRSKNRRRRITAHQYLNIRQAWLEAKEAFDHTQEDRLTSVTISELADMQLLDDSEAGIAAINSHLSRAGGRYAGCSVFRQGGRRGHVILKLTCAAMRSFFHASIERTVECAERMLRHREAAGTSLVLMVGGYAHSGELFATVKSRLERAFAGLRVVRPDHAWKAVVRGAVLFGLSPNAFVSAR